MNYIVYKTTNLLNGRFYVGVHGAKDPSVFDGYFGSNGILQDAIKKYGRENFIRETLIECFEDEEEAYSIEAILVKTVKEDPRSYNIEPGGRGNSNFGKTVVARGIGIHAATFEQRSEWQKERIANTDPEVLKAISSLGGKRCAELGKAGFQTRTKEQAILDGKKAYKTKIERGSYCAFTDPVWIEANRSSGIKGGKATKGTRWYFDGNKNAKFRSSNTSDSELTEKEFCEFLLNNPECSRGTKLRSATV